MHYVFLDPSETQDHSLLVIVAATTGVTYQQQCGGYACEQRRLEGFLIPVGDCELAKKLAEWFWSEFKGHAYHPQVEWTPERVTMLHRMVGKIPCFHTTEADDDTRHFLQLDEKRVDECIEAWVPVVTPYGAGVLVFQNSD